MKRLLTMILALALILCLTACGKSKEAQAVDDQIAAIGTVTLDSEAAIKAAEAALSALEAKAAEQVESTAVLEAARAAYDVLANAAKVDEAIKAIGTVTLDSEQAIAAARKLFDDSSADVQAKVSAAADLAAAETALKDLIAAEEKASQQRADNVASLISAIGTVTLDSEAAIKAAQDAYDALSKTDADKVSNAGNLKAAADSLKSLKKQKAMDDLGALRCEEDRIRNMRFYYAKTFKFYSNGSWAADQRCFILPYMGMQDDTVWLRLIYNYTGDDWVFYKKVIVAADDARFTKSFNYFDIVHDNDGGEVWEYIDTEVGASEIEMLWAIANSKETLVRFQGDDYSRDYTVTENDKAAIRQILTAYEALS